MSSPPPQTHDFDVHLQTLPPPSVPPKANLTLSPPDPIVTEPTTPTTPSHTELKDGKQKRQNPLTDLVETEKTFVDQLTGIIRKVAAAWSRSNLPPPELDTMFRSIEAIYRANRALHSKLKDINADPQSAGELGGLLITWIDDLKKPYEAYCGRYCYGFDDWEPVTSNSRLGPILEQFSSSLPSLSNDGLWTLDALFLLPKTRLAYYLKLYKRLLKNTQNPLLVSAVETINSLLDTFESRSSVRVGEDGQLPSNDILDGVDEVVIDMRTQTLSPPEFVNKQLRPEDARTGSETSSNHESVSGGERSSRESRSRISTQTLSMPTTDLERRLSVERTLDIFTMTPKAVKLQISPPNLTFTREIRTSLDVVIRFTPRATGVEVVHTEGHIFLLSDLFLVCERMKQEERRQSDNDGADMWLCYPPLAGKVLRVSEIDGKPNALQVAIMRKEFLILEVGDREERDSLISFFKECIEFSASVPPPSKLPPPPLPPFNAFPRLQSDLVPGPGSTRTADMLTGNMIPPPMNMQLANAPLPEKISLPPNPRILRQDLHSAQPPVVVPPVVAPLRTSASAQPLSQRPSLGPGSIPPARSTGFIPGSHEPPPPDSAGYSAQANRYTGSFTPGPMSNLPPHFGNPNVRLPPNPYPPAPGGMLPIRPASDPPTGPGRPQNQAAGPPLPQGYPPNGMPPVPWNNSNPFAGTSQGPQPRPMPPSLAQRGVKEVPFNEPSPPNSPEIQARDIGPVTSTISAQMKCKVFLQQQHAQWKALGSAKLKLYRQEPTNIKQLVVEADNKDKSVLISTIVLTDGVERVGKTGVAIELSDKGARTGIVYMIQLRNETSAGGLFDSLLAGSDRSAR